MQEKEYTAELMTGTRLGPGFVLLPQDRYEELIRAETERDVLEATIEGSNSYRIDTVMCAIKNARRAQFLTPRKPEAEGNNAE